MITQQVEPLPMLSSLFQALTSDEKPLATYQTEFGPLHISQNQHYRWMRFNDGPLQSMMSRENPALPVLPHCKALFANLLFQMPQRVLCLGLGGGDVCRVLSQACQPHIDALDLSPQVIKAFRHYFSTAATKQCVHLFQQDAYQCQPHCAEMAPYDAIYIDLFADALQSDQLISPHFLAYYSNQLAPGGIAIFNLSVADEQAAVSAITQIHPYLPHILLLPIEGHNNLIVLAMRHARHHDSNQQLSDRAADRQQQWGIPLTALADVLITSNRRDSKGELMIFSQ